MINFRIIIKQMFSELPFTCILVLVLLLMQSFLPAATLLWLNCLTRSMLEEVTRVNILYLILYLLFSIIVPFVLTAIYELLQLRIQERMDIMFSSKALAQTQNVSITYLESGDGVNSAFRASQTQSRGIQQLFFSVIHMVLAIVQIVVVTISMKKAGLYILVLVFVFTVPLFFVNRHIERLNLDNNWSIDEQRRKADTLFSVLTSKYAAAELWFYRLRARYFRKYKQQINEINIKNLQNYVKTAKAVLLADVVYQTCFLAVLLLIGYLKFFREYDIATCITLVYSTQNIMSFCGTVVQTMVSYNRQKQILDEYNSIFGWQAESEERSLQSEFDFERIKFENVSYHYASQQANALNSINLEIEKGQHIVLVGGNGAGKSTLIRLLLGYDVPQQGSCSIDGVSIRDVLKSLRSNTTIMFQKFWKYNVNVKQNIVLSDPENNDPAFFDALMEKMELNEFIEKLNDGADTEIINGGALSGGQWQKIALARTYFRNRSIIIMDEPNASIDALYELRLYHDLMELFNGKTVIVVSHRLPVCQLADRIIVMDRGKIVEDGTHEELLVKRGTYYNMFRAQSEMYS